MESGVQKMICGASEVFFPIHGDERGKLVAIEENRDLEFDIKRIYYIYDTCPDVVRGKHAHIDLHQVMLCVCGSCEVLLDNGQEREVVTLSAPNRGVYIHSPIWREMLHFSKDCVLLVMTNKFYDRLDYIFDYDEFLRMVKERVEEKG